MRSIRRSLLGYLLVLLALAFGAVWVLVDRIAGAALRDREEAETQRIEGVYAARRREARDQLDAELVSEAKALVRELNWKLRPAPPRPNEPPPKPPEQPRATEREVQTYWLRVGLALQPRTPGDWQAVLTAAAVSRTPNPVWTAYDAPRAAARLNVPDAIRRAFDEDEHPGYFQFQVVAYYPPGPAGHTVGVVRPARAGRDLPFDPAAFDRPGVEYLYDDAELPDVGPVRRVVLAGRPFGFQHLPQQPPAARPRGPDRPPDLFFRVLTHCARPYSELTDRLATDLRDRDIQLARVRAETRDGLAHLRAWLGAIVGASFLALVVGGGMIVARGLAPLHKLSHAVSRVSEKDFRLPVGPDDLSRELAPIHDRLTRTFDLLRRAFAREKQAVADLSHELRTPIASLLATIDVALRKPRSPDQYRSTLEDCRAIAKQLGHLVERIMTLASLDAGTVRPAVGRADAAAVAAACGAVIRPLAEAHGLAFVAPPAPAADLDTDPDQLREVLVNLLHNAVEYNRPGGRVELHVRRHHGRVVFEVRDTGIGMTADVREKIFERFYRADPSRHATGVHAGLGLAIVKEYVDRLGGAIEVESEPGVGSTFRVAFPTAEPEPSDQPPEAAPPAPRPRTAAAPSRTRLAPPAAPG